MSERHSVQTSARQSTRLTILHRLDKQGDDNVIGTGYAVHLQILCEIAGAINKHLREVALTVIARAVLDEKRVLGELCATCYDDRYKAVRFA